MSVCCFYIIFLNKVLAIQTIVWYNIVVIKKIKEEFYIEENEVTRLESELQKALNDAEASRTLADEIYSKHSGTTE